MKYYKNNTTGGVRKFQAIVLLPLGMLALFFIFSVPANDLLSKIAVNPILSKIAFVGFPARQIALFVLLCVPIADMLGKWKSEFRYSSHRLVWSIVLIAAYLYTRLSSTWNFTDWIAFNRWSIQATDAIVFVSSMSLLIIWIRSQLRKKPAFNRQSSGFETDSPIVIEKDDKNQRWRYADTIAALLLKADTSERALAVGITGEWGSGKTSFINTLEQRLGNEKNLLQLHFNAWLISDVNGITEAFFQALTLLLAQKTDMLTVDLSDYLRMITAERGQSTIVRILRRAFPAFEWSKSSIEELRSDINNSLKEIRQRLVIYIDDLDRLDDDELVEVLRIVRNSADFVNVIFVVAYDKSQVSSALSGKFKHGSTTYAEKVFQHEFHLPPIDRDVLLTELNARLEPILSQDDEKALRNMFEIQRFKNRYTSLKHYLSNYRDIARFVNLFKVHYPHLQDHVFLPDLYLVMFLRLKYPGIASMLYEDRDALLTTFGARVTVSIESKAKFIELEKSSEEAATTIFEERLKDAKWNFSAEQIREVVSIAQELFRPMNSQSFFLRNEVSNSEFTIRDVDCFDRYFDEDLNSRLSNIQFQRAFSQPKATFLQDISDWMKDARLVKDLVKTLERRTQFNTQEDFEKVVSALALIDDHPGDADTIQRYGRVDERKLLERLAYEKINSKSKTVRLFGGIEKFQDYVRRFLKEDLRYGYIRYRLAEEMSKESMDEYATLPPSEARAIVKKEVFEKMLSDNSTVDELFLVFGFLQNQATDDEKAQMTKSMRQFILTKDLEGFMKWIPSPCMRDGGGYTIDARSDKFFGESIDDFVNQLDFDHLSTAAKEAVDFITKYKARKSSESCVDYDFRVLKVRNLKGGWDE